MKTPKQESCCCPPFHPEMWDNKVFTWKDKLFIKANVTTFFYIPLNFGAVMRKLDQQVTTANAKSPDWLALSHHTSKWNMNLYLAVDKEIPNAETTTFDGKFYCKVYEGDFKNTDKWRKDFEAFANVKGFKINKMYMWYTTCPQCAKKYGKNYVAIISQIG